MTERITDLAADRQAPPNIRTGAPAVDEPAPPCRSRTDVAPDTLGQGLQAEQLQLPAATIERYRPAVPDLDNLHDTEKR